MRLSFSATAIIGVVALMCIPSPTRAQLQTDWMLWLGVTTDAPNAITEPLRDQSGQRTQLNAVGTRSGAVDGYGGSSEDRPDQGRPPTAPAVYLAISHSRSETGWESFPPALGQYYNASWDIRKPLLPGETKVWYNVTVAGAVGDYASPKNVTLLWDASQVPAHIDLRLRAGLAGEIDMKQRSSFTFPAYGDVNRKFEIVATHTGAADRPVVLVTPSTGSVQAGKAFVVYAEVRGASPSDLQWSLSPSVGRLEPDTARCTYIAPQQPPSPPEVVVRASLRSTPDVYGECRLTVTAEPVAPPVIESLTPSVGVVGTTVRIDGANFGAAPGDNVVRFGGGVVAPVLQVDPSGTRVWVSVPPGAQTGKVTLTTGAGTAESPHLFTVIGLPEEPTFKIISVEPEYGAVGSHVEISATTKFGPVPKVLFNGTPSDPPDPRVPPPPPTADKLFRRVPAGAVSGPIVVDDPHKGIAASPKPFTVLQPPTVYRMTVYNPDGTERYPKKVRANEVIDIYGRGFFASASVLSGYYEGCVTKVLFNGLSEPVDVIYADENHLQVSVPSGASTGPVKVQTFFNNPITRFLGPDFVGEAETPDILIIDEPPTITGFDPKDGYEGDLVTITGTNFDPRDIYSNDVRFNGVLAPVREVSADGRTIKAFVPRNATTGHITLQNSSGEAQSAEPFTVKYRVEVKPQRATVRAGGNPVQFTARVSGHEDQTVTWSLSPPTGHGTIDSTGLYKPPASVQAPVDVTVTAVSQLPGGVSGQAVIRVLPPLTITISPPNSSIQAKGSVLLKATVSEPGVSLRWSLAPQDVGVLVEATADSRTYLAPPVLPAERTEVRVIVTAPDADPNARATATITINDPLRFTNGPAVKDFGSDYAVVEWTTNKVTTAKYRLSTTVPITGDWRPVGTPEENQHTLRLTSLEPGSFYYCQIQAEALGHTPVQSQPVLIRTKTDYKVTITPETAQVHLGGIQTFTAEVTGGPNTGVVWRWSPPDVGTLNPDPTNPKQATYFAPSTMPAVTQVEVIAAAAGDFTRTAKAVVTIATIALKIDPIQRTMYPQERQPFDAIVTGAQAYTVHWEVEAQVQGDPPPKLEKDVSEPNRVWVTAPVLSPDAPPGGGPLALYKLRARLNIPGTSPAEAVIGVRRPIKVIIEPTEARVPLGGQFSFTAKAINAVQTGLKWEVIPPIAYGEITPTGRYTAPLDMPERNEAVVRATSIEDTTRYAEAKVTLLPVPRVRVEPTSATIRAGAQLSLTAKVEAAAPDVNWYVNDIAGGDESVGLISFPDPKDTTNAIYTAPKLEEVATFTIKAELVEDPTRVFTIPVNVKPAVSAKISPAEISLRTGESSPPLSLTVLNAAKPQITWDVVGGRENGSVIPTQDPRIATYTAPKKTPQGPVTIRATVTDLGDGAIGYALAKATVSTRLIRIRWPGSTDVGLGESRVFSVVDLETNAPVLARFEFPPDAGTVDRLEDGTYRYTAPASLPTPPTFTLRASREEDPAAFEDLLLTVVERISVSVTADRENLFGGEAAQFYAKVEGTPDAGVQWRVVEGPAEIDQNGLCTTRLVSQQTTVTVEAVAKGGITASKSITLWPRPEVKIVPPSVSLYVGDRQQFTVEGGLPVTWSLSGANTTASVDPDSGELMVLADPSETMDVTVRATYTSPAGTVDGTARALILPTIRIAVRAADPANGEVVSGGTVKLSASVFVGGLPRTHEDEPLTWTVVGGDANGTVEWTQSNSHEAVYAAPLGVPQPKEVTVRAVSTTNSRFYGAAVLKLLPRPSVAISDLSAAASSTEALITWKTNVPASSEVGYGTTPSASDKTVELADLVVEHRVALKDLKPGTQYWYRVISRAEGYDPAQSDVLSFTTAEVQRISSPGPTHRQVDPTTVEITWTTNVESDSLVEYGKTTDYGLKQESSDLAKDHAVRLTDLEPGAEYHYKVTSRREGWDPYTSEDLSFRVADRPLPPKDIRAEPEITQATIRWRTDAPATGKVLYGTDPGDLRLSADTAKDPATEQSVVLEGLSPATAYYFKVVCTAEGYSSTESSVQSFSTFDVGQVSIQRLEHRLLPPSPPATEWGAEILWVTTVESDSAVDYGTSQDSLTTASDAALVKEHRVTVTGLVPGQEYVYRVRSSAPGWKEGASPFRTLVVTLFADTVHILSGPKVENVTSSQAEVVWTTDVESDSVVEYADDGSFSQRTADDKLTAVHRVKLTGLKPATTYTYRVRSSRSNYASAQSEPAKLITKAVVTFDTEPRIVGGFVTIDGAVRLGNELPLRLERALGDELAVSVPAVVDSGLGRRLRFRRWHDGDTNRERVFAVTGSADLKALYALQYQLRAEVEPAQAADVEVVGVGWYESGAEATVTAPEAVTIFGVRYRLAGWKLDGEGKPAGELKVTMDASHTVTAVYEKADTAGPDVVELVAAPNPTAGAATVTIRAVISDIGRGGSIVSAAEYSVDVEAEPGKGTPMVPEASPFDSPREVVLAAVPTTGWVVGSTHRVYVRGHDALGNWGAAAFADVVVTRETVAPGTVNDLRALAQGRNSIALSWTAPGGDGNVGRAERYDIRISTSPITPGNFASASQLSGAPTPLPAGSLQSMLVSGLQPDTLYYFALKAVDESGNWSDMSNVASARTAGEPPIVVAVTPPDKAEKVPVDAVISVTFSKPVDPASVLLESDPALSSVVPSASANGKTILFAHAAFQGDATVYKLRITSARDLYGSELAAPFSWSFTTIPPVDTGLAITPWPMYRHDPQHTGRSMYVGPAEPEVRWTTDVRCLVSSPAMWKDPDRTVYVGSTGKALYALKGTTGEQKWAYGESSWVSSSPAIAVDGTVYIGLPSGGLHAITPEGKQKWVFSQDVGVISSSPAIGDDGTIYFGDDSGLFAVTPAGSLKWRFRTGGGFGAPVISSPAISPDGRTVVFGADDGVLYALDTQTGSVQWRFFTAGDVKSSPAIGADGTVYVSSNDGFTYAIRPGQPPHELWKVNTGRTNMASPALADGRVYVTGEAGILYCLDAQTGAVIWSRETGGRVLASPCVDFNGVIYVAVSGEAKEQQKVLAFDRDGTVKWSWLVGSPITSSPVLGDDGTLYVCSQDKVIALRKLGQVVYGDLTGDSKVQVVDVTKALRIALKIDPATEAQRLAADVDRDGSVTVRDATRILRRAVGLIPDSEWP
ncbi:MAG: fibronectin type III domain-containing protein [Armatimonadota bacterium]